MTTRQMAAVLSGLILGRGDPDRTLQIIEAFARYEGDDFMLEATRLAKMIVFEEAAGG